MKETLCLDGVMLSGKRWRSLVLKGMDETVFVIIMISGDLNDFEGKHSPGPKISVHANSDIDEFSEEEVHERYPVAVSLRVRIQSSRMRSRQPINISIHEKPHPRTATISAIRNTRHIFTPDFYVLLKLGDSPPYLWVSALFHIGWVDDKNSISSHHQS